MAKILKIAIEKNPQDIKDAQDKDDFLPQKTLQKIFLFC
jgi:hypothetical protein